MGLALGLTLGVIGFFRAALTPDSVLRGAERLVAGDRRRAGRHR